MPEVARARVAVLHRNPHVADIRLLGAVGGFLVLYSVAREYLERLRSWGLTI